MLYICTHKDFELPEDKSLLKDDFKIIANHPLTKSYNTEVMYITNHLKDMNDAYAEGSMIKEVYLKSNEDWIGINHYHRYFEDLELHKNTIPFPYYAKSMNNWFITNIKNLDILEVEKIIDSYFPEYRMNFEKIDLWYPCNMVYFNRDTFNRYCQFVFGVLDIFNEKFNIRTNEDAFNRVGDMNYKRLHGYLLECLSTIFFIKQFNKYNVNFKNIKVL